MPATIEDDEAAAPAGPPLDDHAACILAAARALGIDATVIVGQPGPDRERAPYVHFSLHGREWYYRRGRLRIAPQGFGVAGSKHINAGLLALTMSKHCSKRLLWRLGFNTPRGGRYRPGQIEAARQKFLSFGRPVCVKPDLGRKGRNVFTSIATLPEFEAAFAACAAQGLVVVEEHLTGTAVRLFYVEPRVVAVRIMNPANVTGDGRSSIAALVEARNADRQLRTTPGHVPFVIDDEVVRFLATQGLTLDDEPPAGERVILRGTSNTSTGGEGVDAGGRLHPSHAAEVERLCRAVSEHGGTVWRIGVIDLIVGDIAAPAAPGNHWVLELNSSPGLLPYMYPWEGPPADVARAIVERVKAGGWEDALPADLMLPQRTSLT